jgi:hypothetical protein
MDPVSNATRIAMLLRQRLQERSKSTAAERSGRGDLPGAADALRKGAVRGASAVDALDDRRLKRALIENILADQLGPGMINDARFQQVVDQVTEAVEAESDGALLLAKAIADLRAAK